MDVESYYGSRIDQVYIENPVMVVDTLLEGSTLTSLEVMKLIIELGRTWRNPEKFCVSFGIIVDVSRTGDENKSIFSFDFNKRINEIICHGKKESLIIIIDQKGKIIEFIETTDIKPIKIATDSMNTHSIGFFLSNSGIRVYIKGIEIKPSSYAKSYKDVIEKTLTGIGNYKELLNDFFESEIQYDPNKVIFAQPCNYEKQHHERIRNNPQLLSPSVEEVFQNLLLKFLDQNCRDVVEHEVRNRFNDRYDIWVISQDNEIYVLELKWLGVSLLPSGVVNYNYNNVDRAISGAYQLKDYIDSAEKYSELGKGNRIYCGVLVTFDARSKPENIQFPEDINEHIYPQIDLTRHFRVLRNKPNASQVYRISKKKV